MAIGVAEERFSFLPEELVLFGNKFEAWEFREMNGKVDEIFLILKKKAFEDLVRRKFERWGRAFLRKINQNRVLWEHIKSFYGKTSKWVCGSQKNWKAWKALNKKVLTFVKNLKIKFTQNLSWHWNWRASGTWYYWKKK